MKTGGAFYSSGPSLLDEDLELVVNEPWLGQWRDDLVKVTCDDHSETPFRISNHPAFMVTIDQGSSCKENELCVPRERCPVHNEMYEKLQKLLRPSQEAKDIIQNLRSKVFISFQ